MSIPQSGGGPIEEYSDLVRYLESGSKEKTEFRIGTEHEKFGYIKDTLKPLPYDGDISIKAMLEALKTRFNWKPILENGFLIGLEKDGANISLEPGGQLELSGAPLQTIHETCDEVNIHLKEVKETADDIGAGFIGLGAAPDWAHEEMPVMPKGRYRLMTDYMGKVGTHGTQMMYRTCTVQVNLDFLNEADMVKKFRVGLALQPIATALFANSPFFDGAKNGHMSWRSRVWRDLDADRTGMLPFVFEDGMGFQRYVDYALDVPMYFVYREGTYINALGQSFRDFLKGDLPALPNEKPTLSDWADHLTTIFPEVRIKKFMEMRGADSGPWRRICALPAFWVGLLYDETALDAAFDLVKDWTAEMRESLRIEASVHGLKGEIEGVNILEIAKEAVKISESGLKARQCAGVNGLVADETHFLNALYECLNTGASPAQELIEQYDKEWHGTFAPLFEKYSY